MTTIYCISFHTKEPRNEYNRLFSSMEDAIAFAGSLENEDKVDIADVSLHEEYMDRERSFHLPWGNKEISPVRIPLVIKDGWVSQGDVSLFP